MSLERDLERAQRFLRRYDLEEILEELGLEVLWRDGPDVYLECPDPDHEDANPSFHVCVDDVEDESGRCRLGWFNCWSHPVAGGMRGRNFLDLVAKIREGIWDRGPNDRERGRASHWIREEFKNPEAERAEALHLSVVRERERKAAKPEGELVFPPSVPIADARAEFKLYLERRGISLERAVELEVRAVSAPGEALHGCLGRTCPAVLFPIRWGDKVVNWFARSILKVPSKLKGRYCPGVALQKGAGVMWAPDGLVPWKPAVLVEGIFDAERVRSFLGPRLVAVNVLAVLGGRLHQDQAVRLRGAPWVLHVADGDDGGASLSSSIQAKLDHVHVRPLPPGTDPGDAPASELAKALEFPGEPGPRIKARIRGFRAR